MPAKPKALYGGTCHKVAWNEQSCCTFLRQGRLDVQSVQMLMDTGSDRTMVAADCIDLANVESTDQVPVMCVHGDTMSSPTAVLQVQIGTWQRQARVVVALELPVAVLLGRDFYDPVKGEGPVRGFAVVTRSAKRRLSK